MATVRQTLSELRRVIDRIAAGDSKGRQQSQGLLSRARDQAIPLLLQALQRTRSGQIARALSAFGVREALSVLRGLVPRQRIPLPERAQMLLACAELVDGRDAFDEQTVRMLKRLERDSSHIIRGLVVHLWDCIGGVPAKEPLRHLRGDAHPWVARRAALALAGLQLATSLSAEQAALCERVRALARQAMDSSQAADPLDLTRELVALDAQVAPVLALLLGHCDGAVQESMVRALRQLPCEQATFPLLMTAVDAAARTSGDTAVRRDAINRVSTNGDTNLAALSLRALAACLTGREQGLRGAFVELARHSRPSIRAGALMCLGRIASKDDAAMATIIDGLTDVDREVQQAAAVALSEGFRPGVHARSIPRLAELYVKALSLEVREAILVALSRGDLSDVANRATLRTALLRDVDVANTNCRLAALVLLRRVEGDLLSAAEAARVASRLLDVDQGVRVAAAALLALRAPVGANVLVPAARRALAQGGAVETEPLLRVLTRVNTPQARGVMRQIALVGEARAQQLARRLLHRWSAGTAGRRDGDGADACVVDARFDDV
ncbi:MAG: HEAT repeat domain-containing protein [Myxococcota bacterium]